MTARSSSAIGVVLMVCASCASEAETSTQANAVEVTTEDEASDEAPVLIEDPPEPVISPDEPLQARSENKLQFSFAQAEVVVRASVVGKSSDVVEENIDGVTEQTRRTLLTLQVAETLKGEAESTLTTYYFNLDGASPSGDVLAFMEPGDSLRPLLDVYPVVDGSIKVGSERWTVDAVGTFVGAEQ